jgi:hypothetical protein
VAVAVVVIKLVKFQKLVVLAVAVVDYQVMEQAELLDKEMQVVMALWLITVKAAAAAQVQQVEIPLD